MADTKLLTQREWEITLLAGKLTIAHRAILRADRAALLSLLRHAVYRTHEDGGCTPCENIRAALTPPPEQSP